MDKGHLKHDNISRRNIWFRNTRRSMHAWTKHARLTSLAVKTTQTCLFDKIFLKDTYYS